VECIRSVQTRVPVQGPNAGVEVVDTLTVYCLVNDIRDGIKNYFSASLLPGGTGIVITVPSRSTLFQRNAASIHALEGGRLQDEATLRAHMIQNTLLNQPNTPRDLTKTIVLLFPTNVLCETAIFNNGGAGGLELTTNFRMIQVDTTRHTADGGALYSHVSYVFWKLAIRGTRAVVEQAVYDVAARPDINDVIAGMAGLGPVL
jgi:hypothetical protein